MDYSGKWYSNKTKRGERPFPGPFSPSCPYRAPSSPYSTHPMLPYNPSLLPGHTHTYSPPYTQYSNSSTLTRTLTHRLTRTFIRERRQHYYYFGMITVCTHGPLPATVSCLFLFCFVVLLLRVVHSMWYLPPTTSTLPH
jgi:hypothetical protein